MKPSWLVAIALLLFIAFVVYRSLQVAGYRCSVCVSFRGAEVCRTVDGATEHDAQMSATTNACAYVSSGVTDTIACEHTPPTKAECAAIN